MTNETRELSIDELDEISGGDPSVVTIGPVRIMVGDGNLGLGISGVGGFLVNTGTGAYEASLGSHT